MTRVVRNIRKTKVSLLRDEHLLLQNKEHIGTVIMSAGDRKGNSNSEIKTVCTVCKFIRI